MRPGLQRGWFVAGRPTIADVALYGDTHVVAEGGFCLEPYPAIRAWIRRVQTLPGYIRIQPFQTGAAQ